MRFLPTVEMTRVGRKDKGGPKRQNLRLVILQEALPATDSEAPRQMIDADGDIDDDLPGNREGKFPHGCRKAITDFS